MWGFHNAPPRFIRQNLVFVTFNYRLGVLGFLSLGTYGIPGNAGLKDQVAALYWINRNIANFGGNPQDVTIYGTGSGAACVELIMLSGSVVDLFQKAIMESGSALSPSSVSRNSKETAHDVAQQLGYEGNDDIKDMEIFFYKLPLKQLVNSSNEFLPIIENKKFYTTLLDTDPREIIERGGFTKIPMILAYTNADEAGIVEENKNQFKMVPENFAGLLPNNLKFDDALLMQNVAKLTKDLYFGEIIADDIIQNYINYVNDIFLIYPLMTSAINYAYENKNGVFLMNFKNDYISKSLFHKSGCNIAIMEYIFSNTTLGDDDEIIAEQLVSLWTNFINLGDPTPLTTSQIPVIWQPLVPRKIDGKPAIKNIQCLVFGKTMKNKELLFPELIFWQHIYNTFYNKISSV